MNWKKVFTELDLLAPNVNLNVNGKSAVKTAVGSLIWLVAASGFLLSFVIIMVDFFSTGDPRVSAEFSSQRTYPKIQLADGALIPIVQFFYDGNSIPFEEVSKFVTVRAVSLTSTSFTLPDGTITSDTKEVEWPVVPCNLLLGQNKFYEKQMNESLGPLAQSTYQSSLCLNYTDGELFVQGGGSTPQYTDFEFAIFPCSLANQMDCKPPADMKKVAFGYTTGQEILNFGNYEQPLSYSFNGDEFYYIDLGVTNSLTQKLMTTEIKDIHSFLQPDVLRLTYPKIEQSYLQISS